MGVFVETGIEVGVRVGGGTYTYASVLVGVIVERAGFVAGTLVGMEVGVGVSVVGGRVGMTAPGVR